MEWLERYDASVDKGREEGLAEGRKEAEAENKKLRAQNKKLEDRIKKLEAEMAKVKTVML